MERPHTLHIVSRDEWVLAHPGCNVPECDVGEAVTSTELAARLSPGDYIITGIDSYGEPVLGDRLLQVGDDAMGGDVPGEGSLAELVPIPLFGGPLDGSTGEGPKPSLEFELLRLRGSDEVYLARWVDGVLYGVHASLLQEYVRSDEVHVHEPGLSPEAVAAGYRTVIPICPAGQHTWTSWSRTPMGNKTRICVVCQTSQGSIFS
jgi:hypothetical protein